MKEKMIYWEKQDSDQMCGMHCLNSILQGPIFNEIDLAELGAVLDQRERNLLGGESMQTNVNDSGYFSFQVLVEAMSKIGDFQFLPVRTKNSIPVDLSLNNKIR